MRCLSARRVALSCLVVLVALFDLSAVDAATATQNDLDTLQYALTLEHLEAYFYTKYQAEFTAQDFQDAGYCDPAYSYLSMVMGHEQGHVAILSQTIESMGGTPVQACPTYPFPVSSVASYIHVASILENTGVTAYDGALNTLSDPTLQKVAATIATVEARHASYLNNLASQIPFPAAFDTPVTPNNIVSMIQSYTADCSTANLPSTLPVVRSSVSGYTSPASAQNTNDISILQFALTLERLESYFYTKYQAMFTAADFQKALGSSQPYNYLNLIMQHENTHASTLNQVISSLGATPVPECTYTFPVTDVKSYLSVAMTLENTGVMAYDGAANGISSTQYQQVAATIATVEGRHASYLNDLNGDSPFPAVTDTPDTASMIGTLVSQFIVSCPFDLNAAVNAVMAPAPGSQSDSASQPSSSSSTPSSASKQNSSTTLVSQTSEGAAMMPTAFAVVTGTLLAALFNVV